MRTSTGIAPESEVDEYTSWPITMYSLPGYIITEEIYERNQLKVYRGYAVRDRSPVIIKALQAVRINPVDISKLVNGYEITRNLYIKGIRKPVRLEWAGLTLALIAEDDGAILIRKYVQTHPLTLSAFFSIAIQLTETLGQLHQKGIIHRSLNLDEIFIHSSTGQVTIAGFGTAIHMSRNDQNESTSPITSGTLAYLSPEQIGRINKAIDHRSDLYSMGVVLYEILTGRLPLQASDHIEWAQAIVARKPVYPGDLNPDIPPTVSAIIIKLLAKDAGERYQSANGLMADLEECRRQWTQAGKIEFFTLGRTDMLGCFRLSRKLYGREKETAILTNAFESVCSGKFGLLIVYGDAGIGKTILLNETLRPLVASRRGYFITGKFDQLQQNIPYSPFIQAFGNLVRQLLTESPESIAAWKRNLLYALGKNGAVITEVIPDVELIIGPQSSVEILQPREAQNRFRMVFRNFIRVFAQKTHPLVIFIDDLHWADNTSLELIQYLSEDADSKYLFLIGAYRDNEVTETHPLLINLQELEKAEIPVQRIPLAPLDSKHTNQFVADSLHCSQEQLHTLSEILHSKTGGNPFFLGQLLQAACEEKLLTFSAKDGRLEWDPAPLSKMPMTDDVIRFMLEKLQRLPTETCNILKLAACIGNVFDLKTLSVTYKKTDDETRANLWPSIMSGIVVPVKPVLVCTDEKYEFLHDRVQQAAYSLVTEEEKTDIHLRIGRFILQNTGQTELDEKIFTIMDHLNRSLDLVKDLDERIKLAGYNFLAGKKAKTATDYYAALNYFKFGTELLPDNAWGEYYRLAFDLYRERSQCEYLCAHYDNAEQLFDLLLVKAKTNIEKADIYDAKMVLISSQERYNEALQLGMKGLSLLGVKLPVNPGKFAFIKEILLAKWRLRSRKIEDFASAPELTDPVQKKIMMLLLVLGGAVATINPELYMLIMLKISNISIKYGNTDSASVGYACYSFVTGSVLGDYKTGHELAQAALKLSEKYDTKFTKSILYVSIGSLVSHWADHGKISVEHLQAAVDYGLESGNLLAAEYAIQSLVETKYLLGVSLDELDKECLSSRQITKRTILLNYQFLISKLKEISGDVYTLGDEECTEADFRELIDAEPPHIATYYFSKMQLYYLFGDYKRALTIADKAVQRLNAVMGCMLSAEVVFYYSLAITAGHEGMTKNEQRKYLTVLNKNQRQMKKWSECCPENFLHKYLLVAAETARLGGKDSEAMTLYDRSIQSAHENGYIQNAAIANELAARFYFAKGRDKVAQVYLTEACQGYYRWGAARKVRALQDRYPHLLSGIITVEPSAAEILKNSFRIVSSNSEGATGELSLFAIRNAVRKLSEETDPASLLSSLLGIAVDIARADKGYLILEKDENLFIEAAKESDAHLAAAITPLPLEQGANLSQMVVWYVARTLDLVVVNDVGQAGIFARDHYIAHSPPKSIVCLPLLSGYIPAGVLYLENSLMGGVFTPERVEVLQIIFSQMAYVPQLQVLLKRDSAKAEAAIPLLQIEPLTEREQDVLNLIAAGMSNKEIARELQVTVNTVKTHILSIYGKLQVNRRVQAITRAKELKLIKV